MHHTFFKPHLLLALLISCSSTTRDKAPTDDAGLDEITTRRDSDVDKNTISDRGDLADRGIVDWDAHDKGPTLADKGTAPSADVAPPVPPAEPFGVWTSRCSATPYPTRVSNAYPTHLKQAVADDWVYVAWVWRLTPDAATNHSVSVMKSKDMKTWYNLCGQKIALPVTPGSATVIDPIPTHGGLLNGRMRLSFDRQRRAVITYAKNVDKRFTDGSVRKTTQVFAARYEGGTIKIYQLTNWNALDAFGGGGSLPARDTSVGFSGLRLVPSSTRIGITLNRSKEDDQACATNSQCGAFPKDGTWELQDSAKGLALVNPLRGLSASSFQSSDPYEFPTTAKLNVGPVENLPLSSSSKAAKWIRRVMYSRSETRWITLRADFDGDGKNNPGLFDRYNSRFHLNAAGQTKVFQFGSRASLSWPLVGDWNGDGTATVGIYDAITQTTYLKNSLAGGNADQTINGPLSQIKGVKDGPLHWHDANPAARYAIKWEALPANRDHAYDCNGIPLTTKSGCLDAKRMSSNLYLFAYDASNKHWNKSLIGQAWGGTRVGFDFMTFKNVQLVLYYDSQRYATVAQRVRHAGKWSAWVKTRLSTQFGGWDSHNYLTMAIDTNHNVHISGNMHVVPLVYFRGTGFFGGSAALTYRKLPMTGINETRVTYPKFMRSPNGKLLFGFRSGSSGNGNTFFNVYDEGTKSWDHLHRSGGQPVPMFKGQ